MNPKDEELTAFRTPKGIDYYKVMPFGQKNADATYQWAMQKSLIMYFINTWSVMAMIWWLKQKEGKTIW